MNNISNDCSKYYFIRILLIFLILMGVSGCLKQAIWNKSSNDKLTARNAKKDDSEKKDIDEYKEWSLEFSENFSSTEVNTEPESIFILDGAYTVQKGPNDDNSLFLPGTPMGDFGLLFGPRLRENALELNFSFFASKKGRRMPSIAAAIGGVRGYRLRLNPAAKNIVLSMDENVFKELPFHWVGDQWWSIRFQALPCGDGDQSTCLQFKLWPKQDKEPNEWFFSQEFNIEYKGGKCALWGFPYSSKPIFFDDLTIRSLL